MILKHFNIWKYVIGLGVLLALPGCGTSPAPTDLNQREETVSDMDLAAEGLITVSSPTFILQNGASFAWREEIQLLGLEDRGRSQRFMSMVEEGLQSRGFAITDKNNADYLLSARVILGDVESLEPEFMLDPGVVSHSGNLEKGSLVLVVLKPFGRIEWRGSVQMLVVDTLPEEQRRQRARSAIEALINEVN